MQERYTLTNRACWEGFAFTVIRPFARCSFTVKHYNILRLKQNMLISMVELKEKKMCHGIQIRY